MPATQPPPPETTADESPPHASEQTAEASPPTGPRWARVIGLVGRVLVGAGVVVALFAAYQLWGTNLQEARAQSGLRDDLETRLGQARDLITAPPATDPPTTDPPATDPPTTDPPTTDLPTTDLPTTDLPTTDPGPADDGLAPGGVDPEVLALLFPEEGEAVARIEIPALDVDKVVVRGVQVADLRKGPGLYPSTVLPGNLGNAAIAGHRTTYGAPFGRIDELTPGDEIVVTTVQGRFTYQVADPRTAFADRRDDLAGTGPGHVIVDPGDTWVLGDFGDNRLTLTACHPEYSARQRIVVAADLVSEPAELPTEIVELIDAIVSREISPDEVLTGPELDPAEADGSDATEPEDTSPGPGRSFDLSGLTGGSGLDEGLDGERDAIPPAVGWLAATLAIWLVAVRVSHRQSGWKRRLVPYVVATIPAAVTLWMCFEAADRALPAY